MCLRSAPIIDSLRIRLAMQLPGVNALSLFLLHPLPSHFRPNMQLAVEVSTFKPDSPPARSLHEMQTQMRHSPFPAYIPTIKKRRTIKSSNKSTMMYPWIRPTTFFIYCILLALAAVTRMSYYFFSLPTLVRALSILHNHGEEGKGVIIQTSCVHTQALSHWPVVCFFSNCPMQGENCWHRSRLNTETFKFTTVSFWQASVLKMSSAII